MPIRQLSHIAADDAPPEGQLEDNLFFLCTQVVDRRTRLIHEALRPIELLPTEFRVLSAALRKGPLTMQELSQWTAYERTRLTHVLHGMEARGWITRTSGEADKRSVEVRITPAGRKMFAAAKRIVDPLTDRIMEANSGAEIASIRRALGKMREQLIEMGS